MKNRTCTLALTGLAAGWLVIGTALAADTNATIPPPPPDANATDTNATTAAPGAKPRHESAASQKVYGLPTAPEKFEPRPPNLMAVMFRILGALLVVLAILLGGAWWFRKSRLFGLVPPSEAKLIILETRSLGSRHSMHVVKYGEQRFLVSDSPAGTNFLTHLEHPGEDPPEEDPVPEPEPGSFADKLKSLIGRAS